MCTRNVRSAANKPLYIQCHSSHSNTLQLAPSRTSSPQTVKIVSCISNIPIEYVNVGILVMYVQKGGRGGWGDGSEGTIRSRLIHVFCDCLFMHLSIVESQEILTMSIPWDSDVILLALTNSNTIKSDN